VPKRLIREVVERIDRNGDVVVPLDEAHARRMIGELLAQDVRAIAVSLLWSFRNPVHEERIGQLITEADPSMLVALSSKISPRMREFARTSTTIMSTQIAPSLRDYLGPLEQRLRETGLSGPLLVMQSSGGTVTAQEAPANAIATVGSVLAGGVIGSQQLARQLGHTNVIATDVGGTTFLAGLIVKGEPVRSTMTVLNQHPINVPTLRVDAIGSGGGAIAWLDKGGNLRVGPRSASAVPGPACYGRGGSDPTVTDADLVLGIINPDYFLGGRRILDKELAAKALTEKVGGPLGLSTEDAAAAVFTVQNAQTADLLRKTVLEAGHDPRGFIVYAYGGAGPMHCAAYSRQLGIKEVVVPLGPVAAAFSAFGLAASNLGVTRELSDPARWPVAPSRINANLARLEREVMAAFDRQRVDTVRVELRRELDFRYASQLHEVPTPVPAGDLDDEAAASVADEFERLYEELYGKGSGFRQAGIQGITYRVHGIGHLPFDLELPELAGTGRGEPPVKEWRDVFLSVARGFERTAVYDYTSLLPGHEFEGPAVVEVPTTTVAVPYGTSARVDHLGNLSISLESRAAV
jgi:N-methylhydantoinase A